MYSLIVLISFPILYKKGNKEMLNKMKSCYAGKKILVCSLLFAASSFLIAQSSEGGREEKLQQLKSREDVKVTGIETGILRLEFPNGETLYKNIADFQRNTNNYQQPTTYYSPNYDSTIIDLRYIDTTLYYHKYRFWQEVPTFNWDFDHIMIGDVNKNEKTELYGSRKFFWTEQEPVTVYELNELDTFEFVYQYDSVLISWNTYDVDNDGMEEVHLGMGGTWGVTPDQRFFSKPTDTSLATQLNFTFIPYDGSYQMNDITLGDFDEDQYTDLLFAKGAGGRDIHIFEYNPFTNTFDSVYRFAVYEDPPNANSGFSVGDFDLDGKTDMVFGTGKGAVYVMENEGDNQYTNSWLGSVESNHAYVHTWSNDIDRNDKPEFWVLADAYYGGIATTRITIFETNGGNSYQAVGRVDLVGVFSFYAGTMQAIDMDNDGIDEVAICIDQNFLILKFNGNRDHHTYELYYIKQNELASAGENSVYYGATVYDLLDIRKINYLISMDHIIEQGGHFTGRRFTQIYKPDSLTSINESKNSIPGSIILHQNYPNPFNPLTNVKFIISESSEVSVKVYDMLGKEITTLLEKELSPGNYTISWEGKDSKGHLLPSGVYLIRLTAWGGAGNYTKTIKALLLK
jgi:hypothetical protein